MKLFEYRSANEPAIDNKQAALEAIDEFFSIYHLVEAQEELRVLEQTILKVSEFACANKSEDVIYFCEKLRGLIEAAHQFKK